MIMTVRYSCQNFLKSVAVSTQAEESILLKTASYISNVLYIVRYVDGLLHQEKYVKAARTDPQGTAQSQNTQN